MSISNDLDRLACYDKKAGRTPIIQIIPDSSVWDVSVETSEMTDDINVYLSVQSDDNIKCGFWDENDKATLLIRCLENTTALYLKTQCHLTSSNYNNYGDITYRIDDLKAATKGFTESTNSKSLGLWRGNTSIPFIKKLFGHKKILMRFTPFSESSKTASFNISGLEDAIKPLRNACGW